MRKRLMLLMLLMVMLVTGCTSGKKLDTASGEIPLFTVSDGKLYYDFNITIGFDDRIYTITNETLEKESLERQIGTIGRDVTSHAILSGDYGFYRIKKPKAKTPYFCDITYQQLFDNYSNVEVKGCMVYKLKDVAASEAVVLKYEEGHYRKFTFQGDMNGFYRIVEKIIRPVVFLPFLLSIFVIFMIVIVGKK